MVVTRVGYFTNEKAVDFT